MLWCEFCHFVFFNIYFWSLCDLCHRWVIYSGESIPAWWSEWWQLAHRSHPLLQQGEKVLWRSWIFIFKWTIPLNINYSSVTMNFFTMKLLVFSVYSEWSCVLGVRVLMRKHLCVYLAKAKCERWGSGSIRWEGRCLECRWLWYGRFSEVWRSARQLQLCCTGETDQQQEVRMHKLTHTHLHVHVGFA